MTILSGIGMRGFCMSRLSRVIGLAVVLVTPIGLASAQTLNNLSQSAGELRVLNDQVSQVQRELNVLQRHVYQGRDIELAQAPANLADFQIRIEDMEGRMREMNGRMEELHFQINSLSNRLDKFSSDLEFRLNSAQPGGAPAQSQMGAVNPPPPPAGQSFNPPPSAADPNRAPSQSGILGTLPVNPGQQPGPTSQPPMPQAASLPPDQPMHDGSPKGRYDYAFALLTKSDYVGAERALQEFLTDHPTHALAGNAQYWLGESYYVRNDYNNAVRAFVLGVQKYPKSIKAPDSVLKLGLSLAALNKNKEACSSFDLLKKDFPKAPQEITRRADAERKRLRCT